MIGASAAHIVEACTDAGTDLELPRAVRRHDERAIAAGHGDDWTSLFDMICSS
jgi:hypothetical protein